MKVIGRDADARWKAFARFCLCLDAVFFALLIGIGSAREGDTVMDELGEIQSELRVIAEELE